MNRRLLESDISIDVDGFTIHHCVSITISINTLFGEILFRIPITYQPSDIAHPASHLPKL
jgi:hypothetical protein